VVNINGCHWKECYTKRMKKVNKTSAHLTRFLRSNPGIVETNRLTTDKGLKYFDLIWV
jgi:hypothetical protein